jgi:dolichyl-phosphate-mannose--protein O-mannosyl transferase
LYALLFVVAFAAYVVGVSVGWMRDDASSRTWNFASRKSAAFFFGVIALMLVSFLYFAPFTYGLALSNAAIERRFWVLHPRL